MSFLLPEQGEQVSVGFLTGNYDDIVVVLGRSPDKSYASDVYLLYDVLFGSVLCDVLLERIQIHYDQIDARDVVFFSLGDIGWLFPAVQDAAHDLGMESLHPASEYGRVAGEILDCCNRNVMAVEVLLCAACGEYLHTEANQLIGNV